jgi:hypothetical protein
MLTGDRRAERGDHVGQAELMERDHVHVAFHHQQAVELALGGQRLVQAVELAALVEDLGLRRVEVLRLAVLDDPAAEADHAAATVVDGEHHAFTEAIVVAAALALDGETRAFRLLLADAGGVEGVEQVAPP